MKKILLFVVIVIIVASGLEVVALKSDIKTSNFNYVVKQYSNNIDLGYTHTVFVEVGSTTICPACPESNSAWHNIYESGNYDFEYCELVVDKNSVAASHMNDRNLYWVPTSYWDGGEYVYPGTAISTFYNYLDSSGARAVPDLVADLNVDWFGNARLDISFTIANNEAVAYSGRLKIYIIELESKLWNDQQGKPFNHAFLDFAINKAINIPAGNTYSDISVWDGVSEGFPRISGDNIQVILVVFDDTPHQSYSDPPSGSPFLAYYVDETVSAIIEDPNEQPYQPNNPNPANHATEVDINADLSWIGGDPDEGDIVTYDIYFGDVNPPPLLSSGHPDTTYNPGAMELSTTYYWYIIAKDNHDATSVGLLWDFTTASEDINQPPNKPSIIGQKSGKTGKSYNYNFVSSDPDGDEVSYYIEWGDGQTTTWTAFQASDNPYSESHTWNSEGTYTIKAKAKDPDGLESIWSELSVSMPKSKSITDKPFLRFLEDFKDRFQLLVQLLDLVTISPTFTDRWVITDDESAQLTITLPDNIPPDVWFSKPKNALYINDKEIIPFFVPLIIGPVQIWPHAMDNESGLAHLELFINDDLKASFTSIPRSWTWDEMVFGRRTIKLMAFDNADNTASAEISVWKFF
jgi:hypothetical protein